MKTVKLLILFTFVISACQPSNPEHKGAWFACTLAVDGAEGVSSSGAAEFDPDKVTQVADNQVKVEITYESGDTYICELEKVENSNIWTLLDLERK